MLWNIQFISADGTKRFYKGGRTNGLCWSINAGSDDIYVGEGVTYLSCTTVHR